VRPFVYAIAVDILALQNAFSRALFRSGFNHYSMYLVDLLHEFELGVWKAIFTHLIRILYAAGGDAIANLNYRCAAFLIRWVF
jgi:hypothetical protein